MSQQQKKHLQRLGIELDAHPLATQLAGAGVDLKNAEAVAAMDVGSGQNRFLSPVSSCLEASLAERASIAGTPERVRWHAKPQIEKRLRGEKRWLSV
jgi:hypothetical protein